MIGFTQFLRVWKWGALCQNGKGVFQFSEFSKKNWRRDDDDDGSRDLKLRVVRSIFRVVRGAQNESRSQWCKNQFLSAGVVFEKWERCCSKRACALELVVWSVCRLMMLMAMMMMMCVVVWWCWWRWWYKIPYHSSFISHAQHTHHHITFHHR